MGFGPSRMGNHFAFAMALAVVVMFDRPPLVAEASRGALPSKLSELGLFTDLSVLTPNPSALAYDVNFPLWSDGSTKRRWIFLPNGSRITLPPEDASDATWNLPVGTYLVKQFDFERRVETRVSHLTPAGWEMASYLWDENQTEARRVDLAQAVLVRTPLQADPLTWKIPSPNECVYCHGGGATSKSGGPLAVKTSQWGQAQFERWVAADRFTNPPANPTRFAFLPNANHPENYPTREFARAYLGVNCSGCHQPGAFVPTSLNLRWEIPVASMNAIGARPQFYDLGIPGAEIVRASSKETSVLWRRMIATDGQHMPFLGSTIPDSVGVESVGNWIDSGAD